MQISLNPWKLAREIAQVEGKHNLFVVEMAALLHDIDDWKFKKPGQNKAQEWLDRLEIDEGMKLTILDVIESVSFKGAGVDTTPLSLEGAIVQDADRLDAMGAIGIARCFAYGGYKGSEMYNPEMIVKKQGSFDEYKKAKTTSINHFYEKLLLLKDRMNTGAGKRMAEHRHKVMESFLDEFFLEIEGKR